MGLSSNFGPRVDPITRQIAQHPGIDFSAPSGTPILAAGNGTVLKVEADHAYGQFVEIKHSDGFVTKYAHTRKIYVQQGQTVTRGQAIAEVGNTGRSTGPHLHYEVSINGTLINPMQALANHGAQLTEK
jgi:murein DD-endopeptidase MepM/ murein hydrolase activator NlpD